MRKLVSSRPAKTASSLLHGPNRRDRKSDVLYSVSASLNLNLASVICDLISEYAITAQPRLFLYAQEYEGASSFVALPTPTMLMCSLPIYDHAVVSASVDWHALPVLSSKEKENTISPVFAHVVDNGKRLIVICDKANLIYVFDLATSSWLPVDKTLCWPNIGGSNTGARCIASVYDSAANQLFIMTANVDRFPGDSFCRLNVLSTTPHQEISNKTARDYREAMNSTLNTKNKKKVKSPQEGKDDTNYCFTSVGPSVDMDWREAEKGDILYDHHTKQWYWVDDEDKINQMVVSTNGDGKAANNDEKRWVMLGDYGSYLGSLGNENNENDENDEDDEDDEDHEDHEDRWPGMYVLIPNKGILCHKLKYSDKLDFFEFNTGIFFIFFLILLSAHFFYFVCCRYLLRPLQRNVIPFTEKQCIPAFNNSRWRMDHCFILIRDL